MIHENKLQCGDYKTAWMLLTILMPCTQPCTAPAILAMLLQIEGEEKIFLGDVGRRHNQINVVISIDL